MVAFWFEKDFIKFLTPMPLSCSITTRKYGSDNWILMKRLPFSLVPRIFHDKRKKGKGGTQGIRRHVKDAYKWLSVEKQFKILQKVEEADSALFVNVMKNLLSPVHHLQRVETVQWGQFYLLPTLIKTFLTFLLVGKIFLGFPALGEQNCLLT